MRAEGDENVYVLGKLPEGVREGESRKRVTPTTV